MRRTKQKSIEKRSAVKSVVLNTLLQLLMAAALLRLRTLELPGWLMLFLAAAGLITVPFAFVVLWQRVREIEKGELDEARKY